MRGVGHRVGGRRLAGGNGRVLRGALVALTAVTGAASLPAAARADDAPAMTESDTSPCVAPCSQTGLVYATKTNPLNPAAGNQALALDLYRSAKTPKKDAPVVVLLHGGGFISGDRTQMRRFGGVLANAGFLVASVDYRMVDMAHSDAGAIAKAQYIIPAAEEATEDTEAAMNYIRVHAVKLGATKNRARYAVGGYSAGAITALRVALRGGDTSTPKARRFKVGAAFSISGFECGTYTKSSGCKPAYDRADPPILMFHGNADSIVPYSWGIATCSSAVLVGGGCEAYTYPNQDHFWPNGTIFGGGPGLTKKHPAVLPTIAKFLRKELAAKK